MSMKNHQESGKKVKQRKAQIFFIVSENCVGKLYNEEKKKGKKRVERTTKNCMRCVYCFSSIKGSFK